MGEKIGIAPQEILHEYPHVSQLFLYPLKGAGALEAESLRITETGLTLDTWKGMSLDESLDDRGIVLLRTIPIERTRLKTESRWQYTSQLHKPKLVLVKPTVQSDGTLAFTAPGMERLSLAESQMIQALPSESEPVDLFDATLHRSGFDDLGDEVSNWFSKFLDTPCRAVRFRPETSFENTSKYHPYKFQLQGDDDAQISFMGIPTVQDLNARLGIDHQVSEDTFRFNVAIAGLPAYGEDRLQKVRIGNTVITMVKPTIRCAVTMVDQKNGIRRNDGQPLKELNTYRLMTETYDGKTKNRGVALGVYGTVLPEENQTGISAIISVGNELKILQSSPSPLLFHTSK